MPAAPADDQTLRAGRFGQAVVVIFLLVTGGLCVRSLIVDDARFGWGMFGSNVAYTVHYEWVLDGGRRVSYRPGDELRATAVRLALREPAPWLPRSMFYGTGTLHAWIRSYQQWLLANKRPPGAVAIEARIRTTVNPVAGTTSSVELTTLRLSARRGGGA